MRRLLVAAVATAGLLGLSAPAVAASHTAAQPVPQLQAGVLPPPGTQFSTVTPDAGAGICLRAAHDICWLANGAGNQISTTIGVTSTWTGVNTFSSQGYNLTEWQDANGKCAYYNSSSNQLDLASGNCSSSRIDEYWYLYPSSSGDATIYISDVDGVSVALVFNDVGGKPVWVEHSQAGTYYGWIGGVVQL